MAAHARATVVVSKCIEHAACRYNGAMIHDGLVAKLAQFAELVPVCPEVEIGLGVPRDPVRLINGEAGLRLYQPVQRRDVTREMESFCDRFFGSLGEVHGFILKNRSPSCGPGDVKIYASSDGGSGSTRGAGMFAAAVLERFSGLAIEDEGRLRNFNIREHFLTKLFALAALSRVKRTRAMQSLVEFHSRHKLLLLGYSEPRLRAMGRLVADHDHLGFDEVITAYERELREAMRREPKPTSMINVLQHALGGFSSALAPAERRFFLRSVEEYRDERIPLSAVLRIVEAYAVRFENEYLLEQALLHPYPTQLVEVRDSGKGREQ